MNIDPGELPTIVNSVASTNVLGYVGSSLTSEMASTVEGYRTFGGTGGYIQYTDNYDFRLPLQDNNWYYPPYRNQNYSWDDEQLKKLADLLNKSHKEATLMTTRRLVQIYIMDPDKKVPIDKAILYKGDQILTESTDQELFFEIDVKNILEAHNAKRVKILDKDASKGKDDKVYLEKTRIKDLKMVVHTVLQF